jgi:SSS family transporter
MPQPAIVGITGLYLAGMIGVGYYFHRQGKEGVTEYFLAGKRAPWYLVAASFFATGMGAGATIGLAESTYQQQTVAAAWRYGGTYAVVGILLLVVLLAGKLPKTTGVTIPGILGDRYDRKTRDLTTVFVVLMFLGTLGAQWLAVGTILSFFFPEMLTVLQAAVVGAVIVTAYTVLGGMSAVMWTDLIQGVILFVGLWLLAALAIPDLGGWGTISREATAVSPQALDPMAISTVALVGLTIQFLPYIFVAQDFLQRIMAARSSRDGVIGTVLTGVFASALVVVPVLAGVLGLIRYPNIENPKFIIPQLAADILPVWAAGILLAALAAAVMSTGDSLLLSVSSNVVDDFYLEYVDPDAGAATQQRVSRAVVVVVAVLSLGMSFLLPQILDLLILATIAITAGAVVPWLGVFYWTRGTANAAFWSMLVAGVAAVVWGVLGFASGSLTFMGVPPMFVGLPLSVLLFVGISLYEDPEYERVREAARTHNLDLGSKIPDQVTDD